MNSSLMVVFEGPECTGKSTIARFMMEDHSCEMQKRVRTSDRLEMLHTVLEDINRQLRRTMSGDDDIIIFDRWQMISDIVYEKYCYGRPSILEPLYPLLARACREARVLVIYFDVNEEVMLQRFEARGDQLRTKLEAQTARDKYEEFFSVGLGIHLNAVRVDTSNMNEAQVYRRVMDIIIEQGGLT